MMQPTKAEGTRLGWILNRANGALKTTIQTATDVLRGMSEEHTRHVQERLKKFEESQPAETPDSVEQWEMANRQQAEREHAQWVSECTALLEETVEQLLQYAQGCDQTATELADELFYFDSAPLTYNMFEQDFKLRAFAHTHPFATLLGLAASQGWDEIGEPVATHPTRLHSDIVVWWEEHVKRGLARLNALLSARGVSVVSSAPASAVPEPDNEKAEDATEDEEKALAMEIYNQASRLGRLSGLKLPTRACFLYDCFPDTPVLIEDDRLWWFSWEHPYVPLMARAADPQVHFETPYGDFCAYLESEVDRFALRHVEMLFSRHGLEWSASVVAQHADGASAPLEPAVIPEPAIPAPDPIYRPPQILSLPPEEKKGR